MTNESPQSQSQSQSWLGRHWMWLVPLGCIGSIVALVLFVVGIFFAVSTAVRSSDAYTEALTAAQANPEVVEALGEPIEAGWMMSGSINVTGPSGDADISIPITGSRNAGTIYVVAEKRAGEWSFELLEVEVEGREQRINLLAE